MVSRRFLAVFLALGVSVVPLHVQAGSGEFLENTGVACLVGGALVGTAALFVAPAAVVTVAGTSVMVSAPLRRWLITVTSGSTMHYSKSHFIRRCIRCASSCKAIPAQFRPKGVRRLARSRALGIC